MPRNTVVKVTRPRAFDDAKIVLKRFSGKADAFNKEGDRDFAVLLAEDLALDMHEEGWAIKRFKPDEDNALGQAFIKVAVAFANFPPRITMITSKGKTPIDESTIALLDIAEIARVDMVITPYNWSMPNGTSGVKAYLKSMYVTIREDEFAERYGDIPDADLPAYSNGRR